jgi:hypothetical protein
MIDALNPAVADAKYLVVNILHVTADILYVSPSMLNTVADILYLPLNTLCPIVDALHAMAGKERMRGWVFLRFMFVLFQGSVEDGLEV